MSVEPLSELDAALVAAARAYPLVPDEIERLIRAGANVNARGLLGSAEVSVLGFAINDRKETSEDLAVWKLLLDAGADPQVYKRSSGGAETPMRYAVFSNKPKLVELLIAYKARSGFVSLSTAIERDNIEIVRILLTNAPVMIDPKTNRSALASCHEAYRVFGDKNPHAGIASARMLLEHGIDPSAGDPIGVALRGGNLELATLLHEKGATIADLAADLAHHPHTVAWLAERGVDINEKRNGASTLMNAIVVSDLDRVRMLLANGANAADATCVYPSDDKPLLFVIAERGMQGMLAELVPRLALSSDDKAALLAHAEDDDTRQAIATLLAAGGMS